MLNGESGRNTEDGAAEKSRARASKGPGLAIIFFGLGTIFSGLAGILDQRWRAFCIIYEVLCSISALGFAVLSLFIFSQGSKIVKQFESSQFDGVTVYKLFRCPGWAYLILFAIEATAMGLLLLYLHWSEIAFRGQFSPFAGLP